MMLKRGKQTRSRRPSHLLRIVVLPVLGLLLGGGYLVFNQSQPDLQQVSRPVAALDEVSLPPLLEVTADAADPDLVQVRLLPNIEGYARIEFEGASATPVAGAKAASRIHLKRGQNPTDVSMRMVRPRTSQAHPVRVGLVLEDENGNTLLTVHKEVPGASPRAAEPRPSIALKGTSAQGDPLEVSVPLNAPMPRQTGAAR